MITINCSCGSKFVFKNATHCHKCGNKIPEEFFSLFGDIENSLLEVSNLTNKRARENLCKPFTITAM